MASIIFIWKIAKFVFVVLIPNLNLDTMPQFFFTNILSEEHLKHP